MVACLRLRASFLECWWQAFGRRRFQTASKPQSTFASISGQDLAHQAWALASREQSMSSADVDADWTEFEESAVRLCGSLRGEDIVKILHSCTVAKRRPRSLLAKLAEEIPERLPHFSTGGLCICLHTFAQMRHRESKLFTAVTRRVLHTEQRAELMPSHVASLLYSHARALLSDRSLFKLARSKLANEAEIFALEDVATSLQAFATLRVEDTVLSSSCNHLIASSSSSAPLLVLCDVLEASARLGLPVRLLQNALIARCRERPADVESLSASGLTKLMLSIGGLDESSETCQLASSLLLQRVEDISRPRPLVQAIEALAKAQVRDDGVCRSLSRPLVSCMVDFSVKDVVATATACQRLLVRDGAVLESLARQGLRKGWRFKPHHAQVVVRACLAAGFRHSVVQELIDSIEERSSAQATDEHSRGRSSEAHLGGQSSNSKAEIDWEALEEGPIFSDPALEKETVSLDAWDRGSADKPLSMSRAAVTNAPFPTEARSKHRTEQAAAKDFANATSQSRKQNGREALDETGTLKKRHAGAKELDNVMKDVERAVLRPAGFMSRALMKRRTWNFRNRASPST